MTFYQSGIARTVLTCPGEEPRFSISSTGIGVEWSQLNQVTLDYTIVNIGKTSATVLLYVDNQNEVKYIIQFSPFRIIQYINGEMGIEVNDMDQFRYAPPTAPHGTYMDGYDQLIEGYEIGIAFTFPTDYVYGLPTRTMANFPLVLDETYRLFNQDVGLHPYGEN